jgi:nucleoid-associated protein YgaU
MRALRAAASAVASLALLVGVPWLLSSTIGNPLTRLPDLLAGDVNDHVVLAALAAALYLAWAQFAVAFTVELISAIRRTPMPRRIPGVFAGQQGLARALVSGALLLLPVTASTVVPAAQAVAMSPGYHPVPVMTVLAPGPSGVAVAATSVVTPTRTVTLTGDGARTWWDLADEHLGDGAAWRELWTLNQGRAQGDGTVLTTERTVLQPGWTVGIPDTTTVGDNPAAAAEAAPAAGVAAGDLQAKDDDVAVEVTVEPGDTLSQIAADHGIPDWTTVWPANAGREQPDGDRFTDPDHIEPGWTITIPTPAGTGEDTGDTSVRVVAGDSLSQLAADHDVPLDVVVAANIGRVQPDGSMLTDPDDIRPGWRIVIPSDVTPTAPPMGEAPAADSGPVTPPPPPAAAETEPVTPLSPVTPADLSPTTTLTPAATPTGQVVPGTGQAATAVPSNAADDAGAPVTGEGDAGEEHAAVAPWLAGAGLLAGGALLALVRYRRRQFRYRSPGRSITQTPAELQDAERGLLTAGAAGMGDVTFLDRALRDLTRTAADGRVTLPDVVAARLTATALDLILVAPHHEPPGPWRSDEAGMTWSLSRDDQHPDDAAELVVDVYAPYPTLVSVGHTEAGEQWLLDLEQVGYLSLTGDTDRCLDLARFIAAELAHNAWSDMVDVTLVGFGAEMTTLNPERLTHTDHLEDATAAATRVLADPPQDVDGNTRSVLDSRSHPGLGEVPTPHVTLIAPTAASAVPPTVFSVLVDELRSQPDRSAVAVVDATGEPTATTDDQEAESRADRGWTLRVDERGMLSIPALGARLIANQLPEREAADLAALLGLAAATKDQPMPTSRGDQPWEEYADAAGNPLPQLTIPDTSTSPDTSTRHSADPDDHVDSTSSRGSALPLPPRAYLDRTAADQADLDTLAPGCPTRSGNGSSRATPTWMSTWPTGTTKRRPDPGSACSDRSRSGRRAICRPGTRGWPGTPRSSPIWPPGPAAPPWKPSAPRCGRTTPTSWTAPSCGTPSTSPGNGSASTRPPDWSTCQPPAAAAAAATASSGVCWTRTCSGGSGSAA